MDIHDLGNGYVLDNDGQLYTNNEKYMPGTPFSFVNPTDGIELYFNEFGQRVNSANQRMRANGQLLGEIQNVPVSPAQPANSIPRKSGGGDVAMQSNLVEVPNEVELLYEDDPNVRENQYTIDRNDKVIYQLGKLQEWFKHNYVLHPFLDEYAKETYKKDFVRLFFGTGEHGRYSMDLLLDFYRNLVPGLEPPPSIFIKRGITKVGVFEVCDSKKAVILFPFYDDAPEGKNQIILRHNADGSVVVTDFVDMLMGNDKNAVLSSYKNFWDGRIPAQHLSIGMKDAWFVIGNDITWPLSSGRPAIASYGVTLPFDIKAPTPTIEVILPFNPIVFSFSLKLPARFYSSSKSSNNVYYFNASIFWEIMNGNIERDVGIEIIDAHIKFADYIAFYYPQTYYYYYFSLSSKSSDGTTRNVLNVKEVKGAKNSIWLYQQWINFVFLVLLCDFPENEEYRNFLNLHSAARFLIKEIKNAIVNFGAHRKTKMLNNDEDNDMLRTSYATGILDDLIGPSKLQQENLRPVGIYHLKYIFATFYAYAEFILPLFAIPSKSAKIIATARTVHQYCIICMYALSKDYKNALDRKNADDNNDEDDDDDDVSMFGKDSKATSIALKPIDDQKRYSIIQIALRKINEYSNSLIQVRQAATRELERIDKELANNLVDFQQTDAYNSSRIHDLELSDGKLKAKKQKYQAIQKSNAQEILNLTKVTNEIAETLADRSSQRVNANENNKSEAVAALVNLLNSYYEKK